MKHVGVIDIGKTNAKFAVVDVDAMAEIAVRTQPNTVLAGPPYPHFHIEGLWAFLKNAIADLGQLHRLDALTITTHGATAALVDASGGLTLPVLDYEYDGPEDERQEYEALWPPFDVTLTPRLPAGLNLGAQLFYQKRHWPETFANTQVILTYPQYWAYRLTGVSASELTSLGCHTGLWDFQRNELSSLADVLDAKSKFPPLRSAFDALGPVKREIAEELGLDPTLPVHCGIHDSNASLLPHILSGTPPFSVVSTGTWVVVCSAGGSLTTLDEERDCLANIDALGRTIPSARFMGGREFSLLTGGESRTPSAEHVAAVLDNNIMLWPSVMTGSGPYPDRAAQWSVEETTLSADMRYVAIAFYLAMMTAECLTLTGADGPVIVEGPFACNGIYLEMLGAATGRRVSANPGNATGTSIGAALLAMGADTRPILDYTAVKPFLAEPEALARYAGRWRSATAQHISGP